MRIYLRHRLVPLVVAFLAAVGMAAEINAGVWYSSFVGNERCVAEQDNHYYPYGMLMGESSNILASARGYKSVSFNPYLFGTKEYLTTASANLLDFTARTYDPATLLFQTQDPKSTDYTPFNAYLYCGGEPINRIDPTGTTVSALTEEAIRNIYNTLTKDEASYVQFVDGVLDNDCINRSNSNSENMIALKALSNSDVSYIFVTDSEYKSKDGVTSFEKSGLAGITLIPNAENDPSPDDNVYIVTYNGINEEHQATNTAHEGYGHAYFYELRHQGFDVDPFHRNILNLLPSEIDPEYGVESCVFEKVESNITLKNRIKLVENQALQNYRSKNK